MDRLYYMMGHPYPEHIRFLVEDFWLKILEEKNSILILYVRADCARGESDDQIDCVKNRYGGPSDPSAAALFRMVKENAKNIHMMTATRIGIDKFYIFFPMSGPVHPNSICVMPPGVKEWIQLNVKDVEWGVINGNKTGIFLNDTDTIAFKLIFGL